MNPSAFVAHLGALKATAILRTDLESAVAPAMEAAVRGGFRIVEFTLTTPGALKCIEEFSQREGLVVGAGTVLTIEDARVAVERGARFLVSPVTDRAVIQEAAHLGVSMMPGCHTPTEMLEAHRAGAPLQKLFPGPGLGAAYVRAILGPLSFLRIVPTSGVDETNAAAYLDAGAHAIGFVNPLFDPEDLRAGRFDRIEERARRILQSLGVAPRPSRYSGTGNP